MARRPSPGSGGTVGPAASDGIGSIWASLGPRYGVVIGTAAFVNLLVLATPLFVLQVYDRVIAHAGMSTLQALVLGMAAVLVFDLILRQARARLLQGAAVALDVDLNRKLYAKIQALPLERLERLPATALQARFREVEAVRNAASAQTAALLTDLPFLIVYLLLVAWIARPVAPVVLCIVAGFLILAALSAWLVGAAGRVEREQAVGRDAVLGDLLQGRTAVKALGLAAPFKPRVEAAQAKAIQASIVRGQRQDAFQNLAHSLMLFTTVAVTGVGALAVLDQQMTIGALVAANILVGRLVGPLTQLVGQWRALAAARTAWKRLREMDGWRVDKEVSSVRLPRPQGALAVEDLGFAFEGAEKPTISGLRFRLGPGGLHAIMGANGSGKTTLLRLLQGLYQPSNGRILVDDTDTAQLGRDLTVGWLGYAASETRLFGTTVREAVCAADPECDDATLLKAATAAGLDPLVRSWPDGYDTVIGEGGHRLSAGQRQRVALAQVLLRDPPVLLLDEPTANLDDDAEALILDRLRTLGKDHTVLVATHSRALAKAADSIMVLKDGRAVLSGPSAQVMARLDGDKADAGAGLGAPRLAATGQP